MRKVEYKVFTDYGSADVCSTDYTEFLRRNNGNTVVHDLDISVPLETLIYSEISCDYYYKKIGKLLDERKVDNITVERGICRSSSYRWFFIDFWKKDDREKNKKPWNDDYLVKIDFHCLEKKTYETIWEMKFGTGRNKFVKGSDAKDLREKRDAIVLVGAINCEVILTLAESLIDISVWNSKLVEEVLEK